MRNLKKVIALTMCTTLMMTSSVFAATKTVFDSDRFYPGNSWTTEDGSSYLIPNKFTSAWSQKVQWEFKEEGGVVYDACWATVGYDTWCTNEDYITKVGGVADYYVRGAVKNADGNWSGDTAWTKSTLSGKKDIKHTGPKVTYCVELGK